LSPGAASGYAFGFWSLFMRAFLAITFLLFAALSAAQAFPAEPVLNAIKTQSVHRHSVDWTPIEEAYRAAIAKAANDDDYSTAVVGVFQAMNDVHSALSLKGKVYMHYEPVEPGDLARMQTLLRLDQDQKGNVVGNMLDGDIAYLMVPSIRIAPGDVDEYTGYVAQKVANLGTMKPAGWIVDLRLNSGGNMYPMLLGLRALLGTNKIGTAVDADGKTTADIVLTAQGLNIGGAQVAARAIEGEPDLASVPVVVLVGPVTCSSGQAAALAFAKRPDTILLGEPTAAGYATGNTPIRIAEHVSLNLATNFMGDREGNSSKGRVMPDVEVKARDDFNDLTKDQKVIEAIKWLRDKAAKGGE